MFAPILDLWMKVLFLHGLASSGSYKMANTLRILLQDSEVISPDIPIDAKQALSLIENLCHREHPDVVVGLSMGGFWAQKLRGYRKVLVNPDFHISRLLRSMIGEVKYLSPRSDGATSFFVTDEICRDYEEMESGQFRDLEEDELRLTLGLFATDDELVRCGKEFESYYKGRAVEYPGRHLPNFPETKTYILPKILELINDTK